MNEESFSRLASSFIEPFAKYGFRIVAQDYQPEEFGNAYAKFENDFLLRLTSNRGQLFVEVAPKANPELPENWYDLRQVLKYLGEDVDMAAVDEANVDQLREKLDAKYQTIGSLFSRDAFASTKLQLDEFRAQRIRQLFNLG